MVKPSSTSPIRPTAHNGPTAGSALSTPGSERSEDDGGLTSKTTITTELISRKTDSEVQRESFSFTHTGNGVRGISHKVDKDGSIHLRPSNRKGKKIRALVSFQPRESHFDRHKKSTGPDQFRGFYTLFWISLFILMLNTFYTSFDTTGQIISLTFATLFSKDAIVLAISDGVLVASLFLCLPFVWVLKKGWCRYWPTLIWLQHAWQALLLGCVVKWTHYRCVGNAMSNYTIPLTHLLCLFAVTGHGYNLASLCCIRFRCFSRCIAISPSMEKWQTNIIE
jgi:sterol O-acyltransferase